MGTYIYLYIQMISNVIQGIFDVLSSQDIVFRILFIGFPIVYAITESVRFDGNGNAREIERVKNGR